MTTSKEGVLISKILAKHGARPDLRLWRNETAVAWVGKRKGVTMDGHLVLFRGANRILAGLCVGSADLIGISMEAIGPRDYIGVFYAIEVKTEDVPTTPKQKDFLAMIEDLGGVGVVVKSVEDVTALFGEPPKVWKPK